MRVWSLIEEVVVARFSEEERVEVWDRWQACEANRLIGRDLGRSAASIRAFVESWGGVRPSCAETIATALVFGGAGGDFSGCRCG